VRIIGVVVLVLLLTAGAVWGAGYLYEKRARDFSVKVTRTIFEDWDYEVLRQNEMAELRQSQRANAQGPQLLQMGKDRLGPLEDAGKPEGSVALRWGEHARPMGLVGQYEFNARFRNGEAKLEFGVIWEDGRWRISRYRFDSPLLYEAVRAHLPLGGPPPNKSLERTRGR
jgi:hypothetical protein